MILYAEVECFIYTSQSLKEKRSILKGLIQKIRQDFNVSIAEIDYQSLWQRTKLGIVTIANERTYAEKVMQRVLHRIDEYNELERTVTKVERI